MKFRWNVRYGKKKIISFLSSLESGNRVKKEMKKNKRVNEKFFKNNIGRAVRISGGTEEDGLKMNTEWFVDMNTSHPCLFFCLFLYLFSLSLSFLFSLTLYLSLICLAFLFSFKRQLSFIQASQLINQKTQY